MLSTIRWGIIGCGEVTEVKSGPGFQKAAGSQLVAVMRRNAALAEDYARRHAVPRWYDDAAQLIADPDVDAVYIATPPSSHKDLVLQCAAACKPVLVEKPMALSHAESRFMADACRLANVPLFIAYYRRCMPRYQQIKALVDAGAIGAVRLVSVQMLRPPSAQDRDPAQVWRLDPALSGGGHFWDLAPHLFDFLDALFGPIAAASGQVSNQGGFYAAEDTVSASFRFASGLQGVGQWCFAAAEDLDEVVLRGTQGTLRFAMFSDAPVLLENAQGQQAFTIANPPHVHQGLIQEITDHLLGRGQCVVDGDCGVRTAWVMDSVTGRLP
ncbi:Gfo/Idh/MocA family oxidoreductase [Viridibacterium curvum]|uniref:Gfo/Idh/MocA family oxidoreductase n=1 Tax=Viridibacterium curvum TaxID=1101404 RepID=A0ABP9QTG0_9RHOO